MKRTPWLTWRLYFLTIPVDVLVLFLSADHAISSLDEFTRWVLVSLMAHASIGPVTAIALQFTSRINSWKSDLFALAVLGAVRGMTINIAIGILNLEQKVPSLYKVFNSAISLPLWFIGLAVFVESRRQFQREFEALFLRSVRKQQSTTGVQHDGAGELGEEKLIVHLQSVATSLANDIKRVLDLPTSQINFAHQAGKIQDLINTELRPASAQLWNSSTLTAPKLSFSALLRISLLEQKLRVFLVSLFFSPYIFIGLNGSQGWQYAVFATFFAISMNVMIYVLCEELFKNRVLSRKNTNIAIMLFGFLVPLLMILFVIPDQLFWANTVLAKILYQFFLSSSNILLLFAFNLYKLLSQQRTAVLEYFEHILHSRETSSVLKQDLSAVRNIDLARYLHGEFQAGLIATSLLLERAANTGDTELARHALRSAVDILSQDHAQLSQTKISSPVARLEKISDGWRGIATVTFSVDWIEGLDASELNDAIVLIDEAVANAVRHAKAASISVNGYLSGVDLAIEILSDGAMMTHNAAGLGTKLFNELASNWEYSRRGEQNLLTFTIRRTF
jgi:signal transduction histidine kinase